MKKLILSIVVIALILSGGYLGYKYYFDNSGMDKYKLEVNYVKEKNQLSCTEEVTYVNKTNRELKEIYFKLHVNPIGSEGKEGRMKFDRIYKDNVDYKYEVIGKDKSTLKVILIEPLKPRAKEKISINFKEDILKFTEDAEDMGTSRFGYSADFINLGNFYPIAAVNDNEGWKIYDSYKAGSEIYNTQGFPYYSEVADYEVKIGVPKNYVVAATGKEELAQVMGNNKVYTFKANKVRDFAFTASPKYKLKKKVIEGINLNIYYISEDYEKVDRIVQQGVTALRIFNKYYGKYPYENLSMVETPYYYRVQYPEMAFINTAFCSTTKENADNEDIGYYPLIHELGHQWFSTAVGNNQITESWLDEGFARFSEYLYYKELNLSNDTVDFFDNPEDFQSYFRTKQSLAIVKPIEEFKPAEGYYFLTFCKGAGTLKALKGEVGDKVFFEIISNYYDKYKFKLATTKDFIDIAKEVSQKDLDGFFNKWLYDK